jgi:hypothetical protein
MEKDMSNVNAYRVSEAIALYCDARDIFARANALSMETKDVHDARVASDAYAVVLEGQERIMESLLVLCGESKAG